MMPGMMPPPPGNPMMGGAPGMPPMGPNAPLPGIGSDPVTEMALMSQQGANPAGPNPTQAMMMVDKALDLMHSLAMKVLPQVSQWNPKVAKDIHTISRQILQTKLELKKESGPNLTPPPDMSMGAGGMPPAGPMQQGSSLY